MDEQPDPSTAADVPPRRRWPAKRYAVLIAALLIVGGCWQSYRWFTTPRASADRLVVQTVMRNIAQAVAAYKADAGQMPPSIAHLLRAGILSPDQVHDVSAVVFKPAVRPIGPRLLAVQKEPCRAVKKGEPWGGPGEVTDRDLPAVRFALFDDLRVKPIPESEFQEQYAPLVKLVPIE